MAIDVEIEDEAWSAAVPDVATVVERAADAALTRDGAEGDVVVLLTDDETVRDLNARFRGKDRPTNVLSFPAPPMPPSLAGQDETPLGDIVLAYGVCAAEAEAQGKSLENHLTHLAVHGVLHLLGRDHEVEVEAEEMEGEERAILSGLGISDPYELPHDG